MPMTDVLIIEDDEDTRRAVRMLLEDEGHVVLEAGHGDEALRLLQLHLTPMVVLLDHFMPDMTGAELLQLVAEDHSLLQRHAYVEMTAGSTRNFSPDFLALLTAMHIPVVSKPYDLDALLGVIAEQAERLQNRGLPSHPQSVLKEDSRGDGP
jgi:CheY-like chemotaxis protein